MGIIGSDINMGYSIGNGLGIGIGYLIGSIMGLGNSTGSLGYRMIG